ncbi:Voltage-dependent P/Q-type calcium channel subunit alpha-1A [Trichinella pseudospiralis]
MKVEKEFDCEISSWDDIMFLPVNMYERGSPLDVIRVHLSSYFKKQKERLAQRKRDLQRQKEQRNSDSDE